MPPLAPQLHLGRHSGLPVGIRVKTAANVGPEKPIRHPRPAILLNPVPPFGWGQKKKSGVMNLQKAKPVRAKVTYTRTVALPKDDQRRVARLSRRNNEFARQLLFGCPDSHVLLKPLEFQVAIQRAFGVHLTFTRAISGRLVRCGNKKGAFSVVDRYGN